MRREDPARDALPVSRNGKRTLPASRRTEHGTENSGRNRAYPPGRHEARELLEAGQSGTRGIPQPVASLPGWFGKPKDQMMDVRIERAMKKPRFNDDYYCRTVEEWENETIPTLLTAKGIEWAIGVGIPMLIAGGYLAGGDWKRWIALIAIAYVIWKGFVFLEELNENIRFVRHQLRALRDAVTEADKHISKHYRDPGTVASYEILELLNKHWTQP
jgi:hypothetical protein